MAGQLFSCWARVLLLTTLQVAGGFISGGSLFVRPGSPAAALAAGQFAPPLPATPTVESAATKLQTAAVAWASSLSGPSFAADDLMLALVAPEAFWLLRVWRKQTFGQQEALRRVLGGTREQIRAMGRDEGSPLRGAVVAVRGKGLWSTFVKANVRQKAVHDVLAVRVIVGEGSDVYAALEALRAEWPAVPGRFKDYAARPKANGYRGLHDTLRLPCGRPFELQIRDVAMHREAEYGPAAHRRYKGAVSQLAERMLTGVAHGAAPVRWPLQPQTALELATRLGNMS